MLRKYIWLVFSFLLSTTPSISVAAIITFDDVVFGATSYEFDGDQDGIADVVFSTDDPNGFRTAGPGPNQMYIQEPGLEGSSLGRTNLRVDFYGNATGSLSFGFALNSRSAEITSSSVQFDVYDSNDNLIVSDLEPGSYTSTPNGTSSFPEGSVNVSLSRKASYAEFHFESEFGRYIIDNFEGNFGSFIEPEYTPSDLTQTVVFLDFDGGVSGGFFRSELLEFEKLAPIYNPLAGPHPSSNLTASQRNQIQDELERIFSAANLDIHFTQDAKDSLLADDHYTVQFGADLGGRGGIGIAYDVDSLLNIAGVDRFDRRKDGAVAVFGDAPDFPSGETYDLAEIAAHELGHAFGLFHINPSSTAPIIMDYDQDPFANPAFYDEKAGLIYKFEGDLAEIGIPGFDHNPEYHLRRYVNGEDKGFLEKILAPGNYDTQGFSVATLELGFYDALKQLDGVYLGTGIFGEISSGGFGDETFLTSINHLITDGFFTFEATDFSKLSFFARSKGSDYIDLVLGLMGGFSLGQEFGLLDFLNNEFAFYQYERTSGQYEFFADVGVERTKSAGVEVHNVPSPPIVALLMIGLFSLGFARRVGPGKIKRTQQTVLISGG